MFRGKAKRTVFCENIKDNSGNNGNQRSLNQFEKLTLFTEYIAPYNENGNGYKCNNRGSIINISTNNSYQTEQSDVDDESVLSIAEYYIHVLNIILNNLTKSFKEPGPDGTLKDFSHLQLTVEK